MLAWHPISNERKQEIEDWFEAKPKSKVNSTFGIAKGNNVIVVQVEAL